MTETEKLWGRVIDPALRGAGSGLLFDIPEFVAKQIDREATEKYIRENEGMYRGGQLAGTVAGAFIPVGGLAAKGVQALAKGAQAGSALAKAGQLVNTAQQMGRAGSIGQRVVQGALKGALTSGAESAIRAAAGERDNIAGEALTGAAFGGALGGVGSALKGSRDVLEEGVDLAQKANAGNIGLNYRILDSHVNKFYRGASEKTKNQVQKELISRISRRIDEKGLAPAVGRDDAYLRWANDLADRWNKVDQVAQDFYPEITRKLPDPSKFAKDILADVGATMTPQTKKITEKMLAGLVRQTVDNGNLADIRAYLQKLANTQTPTVEGQLIADAAAILRKNLDDAISEQLEKKGLMNVRQLSKEYEEAQIIGRSIRRGEAMEISPTSGGSPTFEKMQMQQALQGSALPGFATGASGAAGFQDWEEDPTGAALRTVGAGILGSGAPRLFQGVKTGALARQAGALEKLADVADPELLRKIGEGVSALGPGIAGKLPGAQAGVDRLRALEDERANPAVNRGRTEFDSALMQGVAQQLFQAGIPPEQIRSLVPRLLESLSPEARIQIALPKDAQKGALEALEMSKALDLIPTIATGGPLERARAQGAIYQAIGKATGGNTELKRAADREARKILSQPIADSRKRALISDLLASLDPAGYSQFREMGVVK